MLIKLINIFVPRIHTLLFINIRALCELYSRTLYVSAWSWTSAPFNTVNTPPSQIKEEKKKRRTSKTSSRDIRRSRSTTLAKVKTEDQRRTILYAYGPCDLGLPPFSPSNTCIHI